MTNKIRSAFDGIRAEDSLKQTTVRRIFEKARTYERKLLIARAWRRAATAACLLLITFAGTFSYNLYFTDAAYIDFDINTPLELSINRFDRVTNVNAYNADGEQLLSDLKLEHKNINSALDELLEAASQTGALRDGGLVSVTVQVVSGDEQKLTSRIQAEVTEAVSHHAPARADVFSIDGETRNAAHGLQISPAKYIAIMELQKVDPSASVEGCRHQSVSQIKQETLEHDADHHGESGGRPSGHHGNGHGGRMRGKG